MNSLVSQSMRKIINPLSYGPYCLKLLPVGLALTMRLSAFIFEHEVFNFPVLHISIRTEQSIHLSKSVTI